MTDSVQAGEGTWRKGKVFDMNSGTNLATLLVPRNDGVDDYYEFMHFPEWVVDRIIADHERAAWAVEAEIALRQRCGGCYKRMPLAEGYFDGDRWHEDGEQRQRCMNPMATRDLLARYPQQETTKR